MSNKADKIVRAVNWANFANKATLGQRRPVANGGKGFIYAQLTKVSNEFPYKYSWREVKLTDKGWEEEGSINENDAICMPAPTRNCQLSEIVLMDTSGDIPCFQYPSVWGPYRYFTLEAGKQCRRGGWVQDANNPNNVSMTNSTKVRILLNADQQQQFTIVPPIKNEEGQGQGNQNLADLQKVRVFNPYGMSFLGQKLVTVSWDCRSWSVVSATCKPFNE